MTGRGTESSRRVNGGLTPRNHLANPRKPHRAGERPPGQPKAGSDLMTRYRKVLWYEGMMLYPHHFQQWDNYYEELLDERLAALAPYSWGVFGLRVNGSAVANGEFILEECRAVMPDGLLIDVPGRDRAPATRSPIEDFFPAGAMHLDVHLAVPARRVRDVNFHADGGDDGHLFRYGQAAGEVPDETGRGASKEIAFAGSNLRLLFDNEPRDDYSSLNIARIVRAPTGRLALADIVAPALCIGSSDWLKVIVRKLVDALTAKSSLLGKQSRPGLASSTNSDMRRFWMLHTVNSALPRLAHLHRTPAAHPERLYSELIGLAGALMTLTPEHHPKDIVSYDHRNLYKTFYELSRLIHALLETVLSERCVLIRLEEKIKSVYVGHIQDEQLLDNAEFYLGVTAAVSDDKVMRNVPSVVAISEPEVIDALIESSTPGLPLRHTSPTDFEPVPGYFYFKLDRTDSLWQGIKAAKGLAVYIPTDEFPEQQVEMYAVKHGDD
jgi:type VI secretion system protein ImpJ